MGYLKEIKSKRMNSINSKNYGIVLNRLYRCAIVMICLLLVGCPAVLNILFENSSDEEVELLQSYDGTLATKIPAGTSIETGTGDPSCLTIRSKSGLYEFHLVNTPGDDAYYDVGIFSVKTHMVFNKDHILMIMPVNKGQSLNPVEVPPGCI